MAKRTARKTGSGRKASLTRGTRRSGTAREKRTHELTKVARLMAGIDLCMMTTHGARGSLHTRPMSNNGEVEFDGDAWFFSARDTAKVREIERDPRVSLSFVGGTPKKPVWLAVSGKAEVLDDEEKKKELWVAELDRWFEGGPTNPDIVLLRVRADRASYWSYDEQGEVDLR